MTAAFPGKDEARILVLGSGRPRRRVPARLLRLASDERLVEGVRGGSEGAFEALFDRYHRGVLGFCRHMLGSVEEAEDAVQHTFLAAYRELAGADKPVILRPWLYTIARNRCLTTLRGRVRESAAELVEPPTEHLASEVERRQDLQDLLRDVADLPEEQRSALVLSELGDMSHDEIADVLGCRREKVKALVFQARTSLMASRQARETPCAEIREQLANLRGGSLRRNELRRHVNQCAGCREFRDAVRAQRRDLALVLPVAPTVGLKSGVIGAALGGASAATVTGGGAVSGVFAAKVLVVAAIAGGGTVAVEEVTSHADRPERATAPAAAPVDRGSSAEPNVTPLRGAQDAAPGYPAQGEQPGNSGTAAGREKAKGHGKPEKAPKPAATEISKPPKPAQAAKPPKAAKLEKGPTPGKGSETAKAAKPPRVAKPENAGKPENPGKPAKTAKPLVAKPGKAPKPAEAPKAAKAPKPIEASAPASAPVRTPKPAKPPKGARPVEK